MAATICAHVQWCRRADGSQDKSRAHCDVNVKTEESDWLGPWGEYISDIVVSPHRKHKVNIIWGARIGRPRQIHIVWVRCVCVSDVVKRPASCHRMCLWVVCTCLVMRKFRPSLQALQQTDLRAIKCQSVPNGMPNMLLFLQHILMSPHLSFPSSQRRQTADRAQKKRHSNRSVHDNSRSLWQNAFFCFLFPFLFVSKHTFCGAARLRVPFVVWAHFVQSANRMST